MVDLGTGGLWPVPLASKFISERARGDEIYPPQQPHRVHKLSQIRLEIHLITLHDNHRRSLSH
jgi:hypothetical protein